MLAGLAKLKPENPLPPVVAPAAGAVDPPPPKLNPVLDVAPKFRPVLALVFNPNPLALDEADGCAVEPPKLNEGAVELVVCPPKFKPDV